MTFAEFQTDIHNIVIRQDPMYVNMSIPARINRAVSMIAAGIRMPNNDVSPPLPDLYTSATVETTTNAYADLPATYQRNVFYIADSNDRILAPKGGDYYSFLLFLKQITQKDLSQTGSVTDVAIKGNKLYYQGIPSAATDLSVHFYRKPVDMTLGTSTPDGIPEHLQDRLIKNYVVKEIFGEAVRKKNETKELIVFHETEFFVAMRDLVDFVGEDKEPFYIGGSDSL